MVGWKRDRGVYKIVYIPEDERFEYVIKVFPCYLKNVIVCEFYGYLTNLKEPIVIFKDKDICFRFARTFAILPAECKGEEHKTFCVVQEKVKDGKSLSDEDIVYLEEKLKNSKFSWEKAYGLKFPFDEIYFEDVTSDNILKRTLENGKEEFVIIDWMNYNKIGLKNDSSEELAEKLWYSIKPYLGYLPERFELPEGLSKYIDIIL